MSFIDGDTVYALLPSYLRVGDQTQGGGALQALVGVLAAQAQVVDASLDQQYDDQFIETCRDWVIPYIGDLIGFTPLQPLGPGAPSATRAEVADTIGYRRRKGTLAMLEQLCHDVTGWPGIAVEYFTRLSTTQYIRNHRRAANTIVDVRSPITALDIGSAFDMPPRSADVRRIDIGRGRYNIPNIGIFVWRLQPYLVSAGPARRLANNHYTFDPFGTDVPLVNPPTETVPQFTLLDRSDVPFFLQYYPLYAGLEPYAAAAPGSPPAPANQPPLPVTVAVSGNPVPYTNIAWCDLSDWTPPTAPGIDAVIDPQRGRLVFATPPADATEITLGYAYAFSGDYGGGYYPYPVAEDETILEAALPQAMLSTFAAADLSTYHDEKVTITDSGLFTGDQTINAGAGRLVIAADNSQRPAITGNVALTAEPGAAVTLRGLGIGGTLSISGTGDLTLTLQHCTVRGGITWADTEVSGALTLDHTLAGPITATTDVEITITDSAVDAAADNATAVGGPAGAAAGAVTINNSTVIGTVDAGAIPLLSDSIVTGTVTSSERQAGCVRYSYTAPASLTPPRFRCQPDLEISTEVAAALRANPGLNATQRNAIASSVEEWLAPVFTNRTPGQPAYLQLADTAPTQIRYGAEQDDEMGVFNALYCGRREANLTYRINEYLRVGLAAGIIHAT